MRRFCFILFAVSACALTARAGVTLLECRQKARENYPLVRRYDLIRATRECNVHNASLAWLPRIEIGGGVAWLSDVTDAADIADIIGKMASLVDLTGKKEQPWQYRIGATVTQNIWDGGASALGRKTAEAAAAKDEAKVELSLYALQKQVDEVFFSVLLLEERLKQAESRMEVLEGNLARMSSIHSEGGVSTMDLKSMEAEVMTARQQINLIRNNIVSSRLSLSLLTSMDLGQQSLEMPEEPDAPAVRPEYAFIESSRKLLELKLKKLDVDLNPKIGFVADAYYGYPRRNIFKNLSNHDPSFNAMLGIQLKFNLHPLYTRRNDRLLVSRQMQELDLQKDMLDFRTKLSSSSLDREILFLRQAIGEDAGILRLRTEVRMAAEQRLESGVTDVSDLLKKINDEADASLRMSIHQIELLQALYRQETAEKQ